MAFSAAKSTPSRRSKSVSATSRSKTDSLSDQFLIKRDNPLYSCTASSSSSSSCSPHDGSGTGKRGRPVSRGSGVGSATTGGARSGKAGRSLSRVDSGRRRLRSVSREHFGSSLEADREHDYKYTSSLRSKEDGRGSTSKGQSNSVAAKKDANEKARNLQTWTSRHPISESWDASSARNLQTWTSRHPISESWDASSSCSQARNWDDGTSTSSFSEAEERTVSVRDYSFAAVDSCAIYKTVQSEVRRAVSEIRDDLENAFSRKIPAIVTKENIEVLLPEFVSPDELVSDVTEVYASKLEQSQERARKLRADLAVEEQREQELSRILTEIIHTPRNSNSNKSRPKRKASIERRRMSRCLAEEAMNYFDECVSISTFDSSDFSSLEDPHPNSVIGIPHMGSSRFFQSDGSVSDFPDRHANHHELQEVDKQTQSTLSIAGSDIAINSSYSGSNTPRSGNFQISYGHNSKKASGVHDVDEYIKKFDKGSEESLKNVNVSSSYRPEDYDLSLKAESLIFDNLILRNRIESGGLLLCNTRIF